MGRVPVGARAAGEICLRAGGGVGHGRGSGRGWVCEPGEDGVGGQAWEDGGLVSAAVRARGGGKSRRRRQERAGEGKTRSGSRGVGVHFGLSPRQFLSTRIADGRYPVTFVGLSPADGS
jgi:hypothetical protein